MQGTASLAQGAAGLDSAAGQLASGTGSTAQAGCLARLGQRHARVQRQPGRRRRPAAQQRAGAAGPRRARRTPTQQQQALTPVVSQPVVLTSTVQHSEHGNGWLIAVIVGLVLWLAALVAALSLDLSPITRNSMAPVASRAVALAQSLPLLGLAALSAASVVVAVVVFHTSTAAIVPLALLVAAGFRDLRAARPGAAAAVGPGRDHAVRAVPARPGRGVQQRRAPRDGARRALQTLNGVMPLTAFVNGASQLVSGGQVASYVAVVVVLLVWALIGYALLVSAVKQRRMLDPPQPGRVALSPG